MFEHHRLHRRQPRRHLPRVMLDQNADEALERAEDRPVQHAGTLRVLSSAT